MGNVFPSFGQMPQAFIEKWREVVSPHPPAGRRRADDDSSSALPSPAVVPVSPSPALLPPSQKPDSFRPYVETPGGRRLKEEPPTPVDKKRAQQQQQTGGKRGQPDEKEAAAVSAAPADLPSPTAVHPGTTPPDPRLCGEPDQSRARQQQQLMQLLCALLPFDRWLPLVSAAAQYCFALYNRYLLCIHRRGVADPQCQLLKHHVCVICPVDWLQTWTELRREGRWHGVDVPYQPGELSLDELSVLAAMADEDEPAEPVEETAEKEALQPQDTVVTEEQLEQEAEHVRQLATRELQQTAETEQQQEAAGQDQDAAEPKVVVAVVGVVPLPEGVEDLQPQTHGQLWQVGVEPVREDELLDVCELEQRERLRLWELEQLRRPLQQPADDAQRAHSEYKRELQQMIRSALSSIHK